MLVAALGGAADAVDALVRLLVGEALDGDLDGLALFFEEVIESVTGPALAWCFGFVIAQHPSSIVRHLTDVPIHSSLFGSSFQLRGGYQVGGSGAIRSPEKSLAPCQPNARAASSN